MVDTIWRDGDMDMCASYPHPIPSPNQKNWPKSVLVLETWKKYYAVILNVCLLDTVQICP